MILSWSFKPIRNKNPIERHVVNAPKATRKADPSKRTGEKSAKTE